MFQVKAHVLLKEQIAPGIYTLRFFCREIASRAKPGQFIHVKCGENRNFILRRPFSIHRILGPDTFEILFKVVGKGTSCLAQLHPHEILDIIGPMGSGFTIDDGLKSTILVAGGMGIAPLVSLIEEIDLQRIRLYILQGAATRERLLYFMYLKRIARKIFLATEDGSIGHKGLVTDLLHVAIKECKPDCIYACGPEEMLKEVAEISSEFEIPAQVSMERRMGCGIGACLSCVCDTRDGYKRVCIDGPVFDATEIVW
ncbi:MAG: dihydroorotate dehydrogenase electron transfer subunit [Actinomycetota bacterium]|nr:dihydroorotate dehydrogenase electron transfer subunit [Actinomycetota bacterium]